MKTPWIAAALLVAVWAAPHFDVKATRNDQVLADAESCVRGLAEESKANLMEMLAEREARMLGKGETPRCTARNIVLRREYGDLTKEQRLDYVRAVQCLMALPARTPPDIAPGARSRYDDFLVSHMRASKTIHWTGNFMPWHRWFVYSYEKALQDECGYKGYQPYWDWAKYAAAPQDSPIFNGEPDSLGGNGERIPHDGLLLTPPDDNPRGQTVRLPTGLGGGIVTKGPFANMTVNLGPVGTVHGMGLDVAGPREGFGYNPRRLRRDVGPELNMRYGNWSTVARILAAGDVDEFRDAAEGSPYRDGGMGPHAAMHFTYGLDPGADVVASPGDPAFYVNHAQVDRMWTLWQALDRENRQTALGTGILNYITAGNSPESRLTTLDDVIDLGEHVATPTTIRDVMDTTAGALCYFYV